MKTEPKIRKGFFGLLLESFNKTSGCCCGPGETCGGPPKAAAKPQSRPAKEAKETVKPTGK